MVTLYKFKDEIIHDKDAVWSLALSFVLEHKFLKEQIEESKSDMYILYKGELLFKHNDEALYKKILKQYKNDFAALERIISSDLKLDSDNKGSYINYIQTI